MAEGFYKARPDPCYLDQLEYLGAFGGQKRWRSNDGRLYTWDQLHGEIEVFNSRGHHIGVLDAVTGTMIKEPRKGRRIDV